MKVSLNIIYVVFAFSFIMTVSGCIYSNAQMNFEEYRSGSEYAEDLAKQDAIGTTCWNVTISEMMRNRDRHLEVLGTGKTPSYLNGFRRGYERSFFSYMNLYCGD